VLVIATDVPGVALDFGTPDERPLGRSAARTARVRRRGHFASGSMGPKVEAACRFVEAGGERAVITSLETIAEAAAGRAGTVVTERGA
jgi:carbamate kinase